MQQAMLVKLVRKRLEELNMTPYQLHQRLETKVSKQTVYNFVKHGHGVRTETLLAILNLLGLTICRKQESSDSKGGGHAAVCR